MKKIYLIIIIVLISLFLCSCSESNKETSKSSPSGTYEYTNSSGWEYKLSINHSGSFSIRGPYGTTRGTWKGNSSDVTFHNDYGEEIGSGYVRGDGDFYYSGVYGGGERGSMILDK